ncbi:MAG: ATP-binding protein [Nannocystaceae bacterium]
MVAKPDSRSFDVDLTALLRVFGGHLYSTPDVFVRELIQNGLDAIAVRRHALGDDAAALGIVVAADPAAGVVTFTDEGVGLDEADLVNHLSRVGSSTKREGAPAGLIGHFGIGLLSGFLVADRLVVDTRKAGAPGLRWSAGVDGSYTVEAIERATIGSTVTVYLRPEMRAYARPERLAAILGRYVAHVDTTVRLRGDDGELAVINRPPPWRAATDEARAATIAAVYGEKALASRAVELDVAGARGLLWLRSSVSGLGAPRCAVASRGVLVTPGDPELLPRWARFIGGTVDAPGLTPTASREGFVKDEAWRRLVERLRVELVAWLAELAQDEALMTALLVNHHISLMAACLDDASLLAVFAGHLPLETNAGILALDEVAARAPVIRYTCSGRDFARIAPTASARGELVVNACHVHEADILAAWARADPRREIAEVGVESLAEIAASAPEHEARFAALLRAADRLLAGYDVAVQLRRFVPAEAPVLLLADPTQLRERARTLEASGSPLQQALVRGLAITRQAVITPLLVNVDNPLISALPELAEPEVGARLLRVLYLQAASLARKVPSLAESRQLSEDLLELMRELPRASLGPRVLN